MQLVNKYKKKSANSLVYDYLTMRRVHINSLKQGESRISN